MKKLMFCLIGLVFIFGCNNRRGKHMQRVPEMDTAQGVLTDNMGRLFRGMDNAHEPDTANPIETAIYYLNKSMHGKAYKALQTKYPLDTVYTGGFYGFKASASDEPNSYKLYTLYRLNDYSNNVTGNTLGNQLLKGAVQSKEELFALQEAESFYDIIKNNLSLEDAKALIPRLQELKKKHPGAMRIDYLLSYQYLLIGDSANALKVSDELVNKDYYALPVLRNVTRYLSRKNSLLVNKYIALLDKKYPAECNLTKINRSPANIREDSLLYECKKCYQSTFQIDSMYARLALVRYYMQNRKIDKVEFFVQEYFKNISDEPYDDDRLYVRGSYYDLHLRVLFLQEKYKEIRRFMETDYRNNPVVVINGNYDFILYMQKLYVAYISPDTKNFMPFFEKNFRR